MTRFDDYAQRYTRATLRHEGNVLEIRLHDSNGSSLVWTSPLIANYPSSFMTSPKITKTTW